MHHNRDTLVHPNNLVHHSNRAIQGRLVHPLLDILGHPLLVIQGHPPPDIQGHPKEGTQGRPRDMVGSSPLRATLEPRHRPK